MLWQADFSSLEQHYADMTQEQVAGVPQVSILRPGILRPHRPHLRSHRFPLHRPYHLPLRKTTRIAQNIPQPAQNSCSSEPKKWRNSRPLMTLKIVDFGDISY